MSRIPYNTDPDFTKPLFQISAETRERMFNRLVFLYGNELAEQSMPELERIMKVHSAHKPEQMIEMERQFKPSERFTEEDCIVITYGDSIQGGHGQNLKQLHQFIAAFNRGAINTIHLLPFFPYSSDRGFAVVDFESVDPDIGTWDCIRDMGADYDLMFDVVMNHCSSRSGMFREYLRGNPQYEDFFIAYDSPDDLTPDQRSKIFRPRTSDILTKFDTIDGPKYIWTTFSHDQIDFNFRKPEVLLEVLDAILMYVRRGADIIRLDAVTYLWCEPGTECVHLPETHAIVKLLRDVFDTIAPGLAIITETNVPHEENISYFGNGHDEAHMVYNFALPPLVLYTMYSQDATDLSKWAEGLSVDSDAATFFNMLDTHDGIGVMGVKGILSPEQIGFLIDNAKDRGAYISYKSTETGQEPYEMNTTWWNGINHKDCSDDMLLQVKRYAASRSLALVLKGVPGVYTHGVLGLSSDHALAERTGVKRDVNRGVIESALYREQLKDPNSKRSLLREQLSEISLCRTRNRAFHPQGEQRILTPDPAVFTVLRTSPEGGQRILAMTNVSQNTVRIELALSEIGIQETNWRNAISGEPVQASGEQLNLELGPYAILWLTPAGEYREVAELKALK